MKKRRLKRWVKVLLSVVFELSLYFIACRGVNEEIANIVIWTLLFMNPIFMVGMGEE